MQDRVPTTPVIPDFEPVPRKYRHDGWTPERQRAFIDALADTGSVTHAARRINMSPEGAYYLRRQPGAEGFRAAWEAAINHGVQSLTDLAIDRARDGVPVPIMYRGEQVGERRRYNDRLLMWILRHHSPARYADVAAGRHRDGMAPRTPQQVEQRRALQGELWILRHHAGSELTRKFASMRCRMDGVPEPEVNEQADREFEEENRRIAEIEALLAGTRE